MLMSISIMITCLNHQQKNLLLQHMIILLFDNQYLRKKGFWDIQIKVNKKCDENIQQIAANN